MTLADEIARDAIGSAECIGSVFGWQETDETWDWMADNASRRQVFLIATGYARGLLDARTPSPNSPATGGRMAQEGGLAPGEGNPPGLTMPPLW